MWYFVLFVSVNMGLCDSLTNVFVYKCVFLSVVEVIDETAFKQTYMHINKSPIITFLQPDTEFVWISILKNCPFLKILSLIFVIFFSDLSFTYHKACYILWSCKPIVHDSAKRFQS